jgi:hypothetical protein
MQGKNTRSTPSIRRCGHVGRWGECATIARQSLSRRSGFERLPAVERLDAERAANPHGYAQSRRRERDSNPRNPSGFNGFQDRPVRPLRHPAWRQGISGRDECLALARARWETCRGGQPIASRRSAKWRRLSRKSPRTHRSDASTSRSAFSMNCVRGLGCCWLPPPSQRRSSGGAQRSTPTRSSLPYSRLLRS